jgi:hypothetical protein
VSQKQWAMGDWRADFGPVRAAGVGTDPHRLEKSNPHATLFAYVYFYDQRGGGVETSLKQDKQGLGITKRNKKRFEAQ